ncbi:MAG: protein kinase [Acidobacteriota bacterium]|nr:protein kinase [Acidobacteriota bacterium]
MIENVGQIGRYKILSALGAGGMGEVFLAEDTRLDRKVALKILPASFVEDADRMRRFVQEAKTTSALNHPNIITIHEIGETDYTHFIVTEYIEGKTLREHLNENSLSLGDTLEISIQVSSALQAAHSVNIVHRDIKPENIMIRPDGLVKILDFGIAKLTEKEAEVLNAEAATISNAQTAPGMIIGTVDYMSPEQAQGKQVDARSDIFSFGVVLYEMLTSRQPFTGKTLSHTIVAILEKEPPPLSAADFLIPDELQKITLCTLAKNANNRYQSATDLTGDLKGIKKRLEFEAELEQTLSPEKNGEFPTRIFKANTPQNFKTANTIAVLPFLNMSRNEEGDYFSDGLAEELLNVLTKIRGLNVAARTSAFSFKRKQATIAEIGHTLNVASVLEGSIRIEGNRVRISVQLVKVADGYHLWSETYDRTMDDIFAVQDDIAQSVVEELRTRLLGEDSGSDLSKQVISEVAEAVKGRAEDPEAQRLMLLGRHFLDRTTRADTTKAIGYFLEALDLNPGYARGWAELGRAYSIEAGRAWVNVEEGFERSREATEQALSLEPNLAEGYAQLGRIQLTRDWDFRAAESSFQKALKLAPGSSSVLDGAALLAYKMGQFEKALELSRRVLVQDPLSAAFWHNLGLTCHAAGIITESGEAFRRALELVPQRFVSGALLALVLSEQGRSEDALAQAKREPDEFWKLWSLAIIHYAAGRASDSEEMLRKLVENHADGNAYQIAEVYSMREETNLAFEWLELAFETRDSGITHTKVNPRFRPLHSDVRWAVLLKKIGFEI